MELLVNTLRGLDPADRQYATRFVELLLAAAQQRGASDIHIQPTPSGLEVEVRIDGVLAPLGTYPYGEATHVVTRLKVLAELLTYHDEVPQEGRIPGEAGEPEVRVSTFPTLHGERAVVRLFGRLVYRNLDDLQLPEEVCRSLRGLYSQTSGAVLIAGPAGSGKTTTLYASLHEIVNDPIARRTILTLEDPIEIALDGVSQSQVNDAVGFTMHKALRSMLRQDPQVIMIGEIRDPTTAEVALEASLTGQLVLSSFHAGSAAEAIGRLLDMGIEPYVLRSGLMAVVFQRLVRRLCGCAREARDDEELLGLPVERAKVAAGCVQCGNTGYEGRTVIAEMLALDSGELGQAILARKDVPTLDAIARREGMVDRWQRAHRAVEAGVTSPVEVRRVLGFART